LFAVAPVVRRDGGSHIFTKVHLSINKGKPVYRICILSHINTLTIRYGWDV